MTYTVRTERVTFDSAGHRLIGTMYRPDFQGRTPAVVVAGSWTTVKEQMAGTYAHRMAAAGLTTLTFDFTGFGESGGEPRQLESPDRKIRDIRSAITFLTGHESADPDRIGALGICAGSGYTAVNAAEDPRVRSLALIAPWLHNPELVKEVYGGTDGVQKKLDAGLAARNRYEKGEAVQYVPAVSTTDPDAAMFGPFDYYLDDKRGAVPTWDNRFAVMSWLDWLSFDPHPAAAGITAPTVMVHSRDGALPQGAERFHEAVAGPKRIVWTDGTQFDFYDQDEKVAEASDIAVRHFTETLA
ncbi:alpha/beta hydrolase [Streptomyces sp. NPDC093060]|uniref:alpha/beta hydrolase n=1 Tax=Streptomyces sp. NPDC093060 TaxID=3366019 RepID=UPI003803E24E